MAYLGQQLTELRRHAPGVLANQPEAVHQMRVAARRLRSLLASGRPLFEEAATEPLREELRWLSGVLGAARDPAVIRERLLLLMSQEPEPLRFGPAADRIDEELSRAAADGAAAATLESGRYQELLAALEAFLAEPPVSPRGAGPGKIIARFVARDRRRLRRAYNALPLGTDDGGAARDAGLHEVRKAAKKLRYSAELAAALPGPDGGGEAKGHRKRRRRAARTAKAARKVQQLLGQHQDSVVARAQLAALGGRALRSGENGFSYGRLHAREEALAAAAERDFLQYWKRKRPAR